MLFTLPPPTARLTAEFYLVLTLTGHMLPPTISAGHMLLSGSNTTTRSNLAGRQPPVDFWLDFCLYTFRHMRVALRHGLTGDILFFSSSMADVALWLGPYMSISSKNAICTRTEKARKCRQITTNQPSHRPARRPANPPARLAFRQKKQQTRHTKRGKSPNKNTHKKICHRTQWSDHCITLKNMHTMN